MINDELDNLSNEELKSKIIELVNEVDILKENLGNLKSNLEMEETEIYEMVERIKFNSLTPLLVGNVIEKLDVFDEIENEMKRSTVIKTSTRQVIFSPHSGFVDFDDLAPNDLIGINKDNFVILNKLPSEIDVRIKSMEIDEKPIADYSDIGGLDSQIEELIESVVLPILHEDKFHKLGIEPPKGVLMYGPPGTGKTLMARACAAKANATFLKLAASQLVQNYIGDGAKLVREAFQLARDKAPSIIFIDELDAVGTKRFDSEKSGDREVQRTMLELLNQMDGLTQNRHVKVVAATNRIDILDPALLRSGRFDRKIEFPLPNVESRKQIMRIHSRQMCLDENRGIDFDELAESTDEFNGAQCKAVAIEAGMMALRRNALAVCHDDYVDAIFELRARRKVSFCYYV